MAAVTVVYGSVCEFCSLFPSNFSSVVRTLLYHEVTENVESHPEEVLDSLGRLIHDRSPWSLNDVFRTTGTPVTSSNSSMRR